MFGKRKSGVKKAKKWKQGKGCSSPIFTVMLLLIIIAVGGGVLKWTGMLDGIGLLFASKENSIHGETKEVTLLNFAHCSERKVTNGQTAKDALIDMQDEIGFESIDEFASPLESTTDFYTFYRFDQLYQGIPVTWSSIILTVDSGGNIRNVTGNYSNPSDLSIEEVLEEYKNAAEISEKEDAEFGIYDGKNKKYHFSYEDENVGFLYGEDFYHFELDKDGDYVGEVKDNTEYWYKVKKNGEEGDYYLLRNEKSNEIKLYEGERMLTDSPRYTVVHNAKSYDETDLNGGNMDVTNAGLIIQDIYDFYQTILFRNGYDGKDHDLDLILNAKSDGQWGNGLCISNRIFGQTAAVLLFEKGVEITHELIGHEYNHAVMKSICNMNYDNFEAGTIEEGLCDVFGEFVEDYADDGRLNNSCDWLHTVRSIRSPEQSETPSPSFYSGDENWYKGKTHSKFVHQNSTAISHTLYKMSEGLVEDDKSAAFGNENLAKLLYYTYFTLPHECSIYQFGTILRNVAYNMCQDGLLSKEQARCVYQALLEAKIYPYYEMSADTQVAFYNLNGDVISDYTLNVVKELTAKSLTEKTKDDVLNTDIHAEKCQFNLKENASYLMNIQLKDGEKEAEYQFLVSTKKQEEAEQKIEEYNIFTDIIFAQRIVNNGGRYVGYGENTYYWRHNGNSLEKTGLNGVFKNQKETVNQLVCRNEQGTETLLLEDAGYGNLYIAKDRIYYKTAECWKSCLTDGTDIRNHKDYSIVAVDDSTETLIQKDLTGIDSNRKGGFWIEKEDGSRTLLTQDKFDLDSKLWPELLLVEDGNIYYYRLHDNKDGNHNITVIGANLQGETRLVGNITIDRNASEGLEVCAQKVDELLYVSFTNVGGTMLGCNEGGVSSMNTAKDEAHTYVIRQDQEHSLYYPKTHISLDEETGEKYLHFYHDGGNGGNAAVSWVDQGVEMMNLETKEVKTSNLPLIFKGEYALTDGDMVTLLGTDDEASILATAETLKSLGYNAFNGHENPAGGFRIGDVDVAGDKAYIEINEFVRAQEADFYHVYGFRRTKTVVYETVIGTDELHVMYEY